MKRYTIALALLLLPGITLAQWRRDFASALPIRGLSGVTLEYDVRDGVILPIALTFDDEPIGCSPLVEQTGVLANAEWDVVVTEFTLNIGARPTTFYVPDKLYYVPNAFRGALSDLFAEGNQLGVTYRECGRGGIPNLISVRRSDIVSAQQTEFLQFPLRGLSQYNASISAIFDHSMPTGGNRADGRIVAYTGEEGHREHGQSPWSTDNGYGELHGYQQDANGTPFSIGGQYVDSGDGVQYLLYDGHTGYDYPVANGTAVYPAASGTAYFYDYGSERSLDVYIDHGNGYQTYYLHLSQRNVSHGQAVDVSVQIGRVGSGHLHLTLKRGEQRVDPYGCAPEVALEFPASCGANLWLPPVYDRDFVDEMPELIGGLQSIQNLLRYPESAQRAGIQGRVFVQMIVTEDGIPYDAHVVRGIGGGCDEAAVEAVMQARFEPALLNGQFVSVRMSLPITFRL